jgi:ribulose-phosphate 3-epimerase
MAVEIIPAIVPKNFTELQAKLGRLEGAVAWAQIDIADGLFTPDYTWDNAEDLNQLEGKTKLEVHLMVEEPEAVITDWLRVADRIIVHPESTAKLEQIFTEVNEAPQGARRLGLALLLDTPLEKLAPWLTKINLVQLMGIESIGHQGEPFAPATLERVRALRERAPDVTISVDGGVNLANAKSLVAAGANQLVIGSAIWQAPDPLAALAQFKAL